MSKSPPRAGLLRKLARWHRVLGLTSAIFVLWLAVSGLVLNHGELFGLDRHYLHSAWLLKHYGIPVTAPNASFPVSGHWFAQDGQALYFDARREQIVAGTLVGAVNYGPLLVAATTQRLYLYDASGRLVDDLGPEHGLPAAIQALGVAGKWLVLRSPDGVLRLNPDSLRLDRHAVRSVAWASTETLPPALREQVERAERNHQISIDRLVRDLHSGRVLGQFGGRLVDAAALLFVILASTGLWIWWRAKKEFGRNDARQLKALTGK
jgi:hypothetical protein